MDRQKVRTCSLTDKNEVHWREKLETISPISQNEKTENNNTQKQPDVKIFQAPSVPLKRKLKKEQTSVKRVRQ